MPFYSFAEFDAFQKSFHCKTVYSQMIGLDYIPWTIAALYIAFVFLGPRVMKDRAPVSLKSFVMLWNFTLAIGSFIGAYYSLPAFLDTVLNGGERALFCKDADTWYYGGASGFWMTVFMFSKIPELVDTVFLVLQKKPVILLHWYHHFTVMLFCWYAYITRVPGGSLFATMNYCVHAIMYTYYGMMEASKTTRRIAKPFAMLITTLQILQMVVGTYATVRTKMLLDGPDGASCASDRFVNIAALVMYFSYLVLFVHLFYKKYFSPPRKTKQE